MARSPSTAVPRAKRPQPRVADPDFMESLARGLAVLRAFGGGRTRLTGADVAAITGLSRAACRRCLHTLGVLGYATTAEGAYELTPAVLALGGPFTGPGSIASIAQPVLDRLAARVEESVGVAVLDGNEIAFLARASARRILSVEISVGSRLPAAATASGRLIAAYGDDGARARFASTIPLVRHTRRTIVDRRELRAELERVRLQGYAVVDQELEVGLRSIAVPIVSADGRIVAALNAGAQAARADVRAMQRDLLPALKDAAAEIAAGLTPRAR